MNSQMFSHRIDNSQTPYSADGWWKGRCPAHEDRTPSLSWKDGAKKITMRCFAGCTRADVLKALGLTERDMFVQETLRERIARYVARDAARDAEGRS